MSKKTKEPWEMLREEYNSNLPENEKRKLALKEEHEQIRCKIKANNQGSSLLNPFSPLHREYSQQAFRELKNKYTDITTFFDIEPTPHAAIVFNAIKEGKAVPADVLAEYHSLHPKPASKKKRHENVAGCSL